jgi:N-methylhydantoinase B
MHDPFTLSVIQAALNNAADEMFAVLRKTAMSPIIYEVLDVGTGVTDAKGRLVSSGAGIPSFVGVLDKAVQWVIGQFGDTIRDGDVFITNDPNHGGVTHLNDVVIAKPVFFSEKLCCLDRIDWALG